MNDKTKTVSWQNIIYKVSLENSLENWANQISLLETQYTKLLNPEDTEVWIQKFGHTEFSTPVPSKNQWILQ